MAARNKEVKQPAVQGVSAPAVPATVAPVVLEGVLLPTEAGAFQSYGERIGKNDKDTLAIARMIVDAMPGKTYEQVMEDRAQFVIGYALSRKGQTKAGAKFWERNVRAVAAELNCYPESTKSSAKRTPSEAQAKLDKMSDADAKKALADASTSGDVANMAKFAGLLAKREKAANAEKNKAKTEARAKAWKPLKETIDTLDTSELIVLRNFVAVLVEARKDATRLKTIAKAIAKK